MTSSPAKCCVHWYTSLVVLHRAILPVKPPGRELAMAEDQRPGTIYWLDHVAVPSNDLDQWIRFQLNVIGAQLNRINGLTTEAHQKNQGVAAFCLTPNSMTDGFLSSSQLPAAADPGTGLPRFGYFIRLED